MALGQSVFGNRSQGNGKKTINVYSNFGMTNSQTVEQYAPTAINFTFWQGTLKVSIAPLKQVQGQDYPVVDRDREVSAYIKHTKAYILSQEINKLINGEFASVGVPSGANTFVSVNDGSEFGLDVPCIVIRKFSKDLNSIEEEALFICRKELSYAVHNFDSSTLSGDNDTEAYKYQDLVEFRTLLEEYYRSMTMAQAYAVQEASQYGNRSNIASIANSLGGDSDGGNRWSSNNSGNNLNQGNSFQTGTIDDL